jgi:hypothetical protein
MNNEEELFETCIELRRRVNDLEDKIQEILDFLVKTHITVHEMEEVEMIATEEKEKEMMTY